MKILCISSKKKLRKLVEIPESIELQQQNKQTKDETKNELQQQNKQTKDELQQKIEKIENKLELAIEQTENKFNELLKDRYIKGRCIIHFTMKLDKFFFYEFFFFSGKIP